MGVILKQYCFDGDFGRLVNIQIRFDDPKDYFLKGINIQPAELMTIKYS